MIKHFLKSLFIFVLVISLSVNPVLAADITTKNTDNQNHKGFITNVNPSFISNEKAEAITKVLRHKHTKKNNFKMTNDDLFLRQDKPDDYSSFYEDEDIYISFYLSDSYQEYYTIPMIVFMDENLEEVLNGGIPDTPLPKGISNMHYSGTFPIKELNLQPGNYYLGVLALPCNANGEVVEDLSSFDPPAILTPFTIMARHTETHVHTNSSPVQENVISATCTKNGSYDSVIYCATCGEELSRTTYSIDALGHDYVFDSTNVVNCEAGGSAVYICSRCGANDIRTIAPKQHSWNNGAIVKQATCTTDGEKRYSCTACSATRSEIIAKTGHTFVVTIKDPTYDSEGYKKYTCSTCGYTETYVIEKLQPEEKPEEIPEPEPVTKVTISSVTNTSTGIKLKWNKNDIASGYVIYCSKSGSAYKKIATIKKNTTLSYTDKKATSYGSKYSYKIRSYKTSNGKTTYLDYSSAKATIRIKNPTLSSVKSTGQGKAKATIKSKNSKATGYQIQYSTYSDFSSNTKTGTITQNTTLTKSFSSLSVGKKYYFRARAYKSSNGKRYYSAWSSKKTFTVVGINKTNLTLEKGKTSTLKSIGTSKDAKWKSSNTSVATVNSSGKVTAKGTGTATITMTIGNVKYTCTVKVTSTSAKKVACDKLYNYIQKNGGTNSSGDKFIRYDYDNYTFGIVYESSKNKFLFLMVDDDGLTLSSYMNRNGSSSMDIEMTYIGTSTYINSSIVLDMATYSKDDTLTFFLNSNNTTYSLAQNLSNSALRLAMAGWRTLIEGKNITTMKDLGFKKW